jgi:hypothetical protein
MTNNHLRGCGFLALLQFLPFTIRRADIDEIEKGKARGGEIISCNGSKRCRI